MKTTLWQTVFVGVYALLAVSRPSRAAVSLVFTNVGSLTATSTVAPGGTFSFSVQEAESLTSDRISGVDYQIKSSASNIVEFLSRNSSVGQFSSPNGFGDGYLNSSSYSPHVLIPDSGTDLGTSLSDPAASVIGPAMYDTADYSFKVLPGTPIGVYTLSFTNADYLGPPPNYNSIILTPTSTFTVVVASSVPEPAVGTLLLLLIGAGRPVRRRTR